MIVCKPQKLPVSLWIVNVTLTEPGDTKPKKQNWDRLKIFKIKAIYITWKNRDLTVKTLFS